MPEAVLGYMLVDTGATRTCMALDTAHELGLTRIGLQKTYGAGGLHENELFQAHLSLMVTDGLAISSTLQVMGIPDLNKHLAGLGPDPDGYPTRMIGLLGREFLRHTVLTYNGLTGELSIAMNYETLIGQPRVKPSA